MSIEVVKECFSDLDGALADIRSRGLWPTTYVVDKATEAPLHWHTEDVYGYIVGGSSYALDEDGAKIPVRAGDLLIIPARTLHAEGEISETMTTIVGIPEPLKPEAFLRPRLPHELASRQR